VDRAHESTITLIQNIARNTVVSGDWKSSYNLQRKVLLGVHGIILSVLLLLGGHPNFLFVHGDNRELVARPYKQVFDSLYK
jgi:hypothetical protein